MNKSNEYTHLLTQLISIPSISKSEKARADFLEDWLLKRELIVNRIYNNLIISTTNYPDKAEILLNSHIDTVQPADNWHSDPYNPIQDNNKIIGLGSNDAGASVVALIFSYLNVREWGIADRFVLVLSAEEEISGKQGLGSVLPVLPNLKFGIVGEPTKMQPAIAERGLMVLDGRSTGVSGHAARKEGVNAIYKAIKDIEAIRCLKFSNQSVWLDDPSAQVTMINAGTGHNTVPGECKFVVDVRSNDKYTNDDLLHILENHCESELIPRSLRLNSSALPENHPVYKLLLMLKMKPFGSPTLSDMALMDFPAVKIGPGDSSRSHSANEYIYESEIESGVKIYSGLIREINCLIPDL